MSATYKQLGERVGALVDEKNTAYGSSFAASGDFLRLLYPNGLRPEQYAYALLLVRIFDKQMRIATDADALGESPFQDIAGYGLLGARMHEEQRCGSASVRGAVEQSMEQSGSAAPNAPRPTTTSAEPQTAQPSAWQWNAPLNGSLRRTVVLHAVTEQSLAAAARAKELNRRGICAQTEKQINHPLPGSGCMVVVDSSIMNGLCFCGEGCRQRFERSMGQ